MVKDKQNKITTTLRVTATGEFYDDEASEETLRYCIEQDLEDAGFEVDVSLLKDQEAVEPQHNHLLRGGWACGKCGMGISGYFDYCPYCGQAVRWHE